MKLQIQDYWLNHLQDLRPTTQRAHAEVLQVIARSSGVTRAQIARELARTPGGLHQTMTRLLERGLVVRQRGYFAAARRPSYFYFLKPVLLDGEVTVTGRFGDAYRVKRIQGVAPNRPYPDPSQPSLL